MAEVPDDLFSPRKPGGKGFGEDQPLAKGSTAPPPQVPLKEKKDADAKKLAASHLAASLDDEEMGGYDADDFLEPVSEDLHCLTCLNVLRDPVLTGCCGARMCESCVAALMKSKFTPACPQCREPKESMATMLDKKLQREMGELKVMCAHHGLGCKWTGILRERQPHLKHQCEYELLECPKMCGKKMPRFRIVDHLENACLKRDYECPHCGQEGRFDKIMESHYPVCEKFPVLCPNHCEYGTVERCKQAWHLKEECPLQLVRCDFFEVGPGCRTELKRQDLSLHLDESQVAHLGMMASEMQMLSKDNGELLKDLREHDKSLLELQREVHTLMRTIPLAPAEYNLNEYKKKREQKLAWFSPSFYTHFEGYKMCLKVYPSGEPKSQFVSLYPIMQRGEYDDQLNFPVDIEIRVQLIQKLDPSGERYERIKTFRFNRCITGSLGDDEGYSLGWPDFIRRDALENPPKNSPHYLVRNNVVIWVNTTPLVANKTLIKANLV